jgi:transposase
VHAGRANQITVRDALWSLKERLWDAPKITVVWDGASYHRAKGVLAYAAKLGMEIVPLPGYSPDLMSVEELWNWFRQEVTRNKVFATREDLIQAALDF